MVNQAGPDDFVFPARAGMILVNGSNDFAVARIPRESGDDPYRLSTPKHWR